MNDKFVMENSIEEKILKPGNGWTVLILSILAYLGSIIGIACTATCFGGMNNTVCVIAFVVFVLYACIGWLWWLGLKVIRPNEAVVLTLFGKYIGTVKTAGFFYVNPFCVSVNPAASEKPAVRTNVNGIEMSVGGQITNRKISLKAMTHDNNKQKINDVSGNPLEVGIIVVWRVRDTARAAFNVENYIDFLSTQADSALRDVVRCYPYDSTDSDEKTLRGSSAEIADKLRSDLASRVDFAGLEIIEARITHLAYATEIAAAMLQRQQATAIIEARQKIVDGAVGMVQMALEKINDEGICELDDERKAQMVSNLLVVLCGNKDAQPIVNTGTLY